MEKSFLSSIVWYTSADWDQKYKTFSQHFKCVAIENLFSENFMLATAPSKIWTKAFSSFFYIYMDGNEKDWKKLMKGNQKRNKNNKLV